MFNVRPKPTVLPERVDTRRIRGLARWLSLPAMWLLILSCSPDTPASRSMESRAPNILWITNEDMSPRLGCYGDSTARTPNIDQLAAEGLLFTHAFSISGVCSPSRSALISGMYPTSITTLHHRTTTPDNPCCDPYLGVPPPEVKGFPEYLRAAGYYCTNNAKTDYQFGVPFTIWDENGRNAHWRNRPDPDQPFFAVFNTAMTHESRLFREEAAAALQDSFINAGNAFVERRNYITDRSTVPLPPYFPDHPEVREDVARQYDNINRMDGWVGDLLVQLEADGLAENTIVFYFSDHGTCLPRGKRWLYDSGIRVPLIIRFPDGQDAGTVTDRLVSFIDFGPTVLSLAGIEPPDHMQGRAFLGPYAGDARTHIFAARDRTDAHTDQIRAVRDHRYKYIENWNPEIPYGYPLAYAEQIAMNPVWRRLAEQGRLSGPAAAWHQPKPEEELYDLADDPHEINNLIDDPRYADRREALRTQLEAWKSRTGDLGRMPEQELRDSIWPGGTQPATQNPAFEPLADGRLRLNAATPGASIGYRWQGESGYHLYIAPIDLGGSRDTLFARATRYGYSPSEETSFILQRENDPK